MGRARRVSGLEREWGGVEPLALELAPEAKRGPKSKASSRSGLSTAEQGRSLNTQAPDRRGGAALGLAAMTQSKPDKARAACVSAPSAAVAAHPFARTHPILPTAAGRRRHRRQLRGLSSANASTDARPAPRAKFRSQPCRFRQRPGPPRGSCLDGRGPPGSATPGGGARTGWWSC